MPQPAEVRPLYPSRRIVHGRDPARTDETHVSAITRPVSPDADPYARRSSNKDLTMSNPLMFWLDAAAQWTSGLQGTSATREDENTNPASQGAASPGSSDAKQASAPAPQTDAPPQRDVKRSK